MSKFIRHLTTITKHKIIVGKLCFKCGLYKQALMHDLSKYSWIEFSNGVRYFQGNRSPIDKEKEEKGYSLGWLHHKGKNKHHWEYWIDMRSGGMGGIEIPKQYVVEMFCDRVAATMIYQKEQFQSQGPLEYYMKGKDRYIMHENTHALLYSLLKRCADYGIEETIQYIKMEVLK